MATSPAKKTQTSSGPTNPADEAGADQVQAIFDEAAEKGYFGTVPDETPNEHYTLAGVTAGKPTPENQRGK